MAKNNRIICLLLAAVCLLSGCSIHTVEDMYCLPKRSESYLDLQTVIDENLSGLQYCAPLSGQNRQSVQMADLTGDGQAEYLLFARGTDEAPLKILIFSREDGQYRLIQTVTGNGAAFDLVEYVQMDGEGGVELIVGRQLNDQVLRSVSVYSLTGGELRQLVATQYSKFLTCDLDTDGNRELMVLRPGQTDGDAGIAELYSVRNGAMERANEAPLSAPVENLKRIISGNLHGGQPGVFVGSSVGEDAIITDIFTVVNGRFSNVSLSSESGTSVQTLRNYYVYADDIDSDGEVELPDLITMIPVDTSKNAVQQHLIRWYAIAKDGSEAEKAHTFHNFMDGWYLELADQWASRISVVPEENTYSFYLWDESRTEAQKVFTIYALSGQDREEQSIAENRFVLYKNENVIYAARMEVASGALELSQANLIESFHLIRQDWNTGEM